MLVHHADAPPDGVAGVGEAHRLAVETDLARVGVHQAEQDVHERGLAGAVLPQQAVDLTRLEGEVHAVVSDERPERLGDADQLEPHGASRSPSGASTAARRPALPELPKLPRPWRLIAAAARPEGGLSVNLSSTG